MISKYVPERGDIVWSNLDPQAGHEQQGVRPVLVLSPKEYNQKVKLGLFCPITNQIKGYPYEVLLPKNLKVNGAVLSDQLKSLDWSERGAKFICKIPENLLSEVISKILTLIK